MLRAARRSSISAARSLTIPATSSQDGRAAAWERTYAARTPEELDEAYRVWAPTYDEDSIRRFGYAAPAAAAELLSRHLVDPGARILDAGAGTGLVGGFLKERGFVNLVALDRSHDML